MPNPGNILGDKAWENGEDYVIYTNSGHGGIFQYHEEFLKKAIPFLTQ
ncbi:hypothetical protein [Flavobacterium sp. MDT1-60]|nr:hypothetical protein [Flavobacterium sp. MDT1-60]QOG01152.1 hypothetical protein IHE43_15170 [Flavobacterium sp. MDT1-60]